MNWLILGAAILVIAVLRAYFYSRDYNLQARASVKRNG